MSNKPSTLGVFIDFEKAYDLIWKEGLLVKLFRLGLRGRIFSFVRSFISNRFIQTRVGGCLSSPFGVENGVPQGSVISPVLFLVMINDLVVSDLKYVSIFADDTAFWINGSNITILNKQLQRAFDEIYNWCSAWCFKISESKTQCILFSYKRNVDVTLRLATPAIGLPLVNEIRFLGLIFDRHLTWSSHINYIADKCFKRLNVLRCVSGTAWGCNKSTLLVLYRVVNIDYRYRYRYYRRYF